MGRFQYINSSKDLRLAVKKLLEEIFGREFLEKELKKYYANYKSKSKELTEYNFLDDVSVHPAAKW